MTYTHRHTQPGFSIMELIFYVAIVGVLMSILFVGVPAVTNYVKQQKTQTNLNLVKTSIQLYHSRKGSYPEKLQDLVAAAIVTKKDSERVFKDGWDNNFQYKLTPQSAHPYDLYSYGSEGPGGDREGRIGAWE